ncbi:hypothetical protein METBIDRAFT_29571 [Metschnikowia bicuspidata var. bicuspidata NRRL YB-4993]|uniref:Uncharacterized protein n=1 Tax=Metschnikowia bicuspidata var. bicuspidata NRRL YB-4993 TaxID=869754 RepID=A0A1A0HFU4_9ASCO|nr:hypothetical protein METBIDRAFT_29571 [Metschnikowia bicuspidata var. bicuspidata NRRL YB-4993]OBA23029.1 hypothetical protein METBIDRAFT_29571 [Metschnikowia bicuspidata var. bicuspidata NRRL YB-4993]
MASLINGDLTESYFHLSLDHSDPGSASDDLSVHTMDEFLAYLRLARAHDASARGGTAERDFPGDEAAGGRRAAYESPFQRADRARRHFSDPVLAPGALQLTPLPAGRGGAAKNGPAAARQDDFFGALRQHGPAARTAAQHAPNAAAGRGAAPATPGIDVEALFRAFQPLLDQYLRAQNAPPQGESRAPPHASHAPDSDPDSAADDTFDRPKHAGARPARPELSSPVTSPPQSSGDSQFCFDKSTEVEHSDGCQQIAVPEQKRPRAPRLELGDLTVDEIDMDLGPREAEDAARRQAAESHGESLAAMRLKLDQYQRDNAGMQNELGYLRGQVDALLQAASESRQAAADAPGACSDAGALPVETRPIPGVAGGGLDAFQDNLPQQFRPFYERLQLHKVDALGDSEKSNLIKNLMLLLLVSDFDHLSVMTPKVGAYLRITTAFLDSLHAKLYPDQDMQPLQYLRNYNIDINDGLEACLDGMRRLLFEA